MGLHFFLKARQWDWIFCLKKKQENRTGLIKKKPKNKRMGVSYTEDGRES